MNTSVSVDYHTPKLLIRLKNTSIILSIYKLKRKTLQSKVLLIKFLIYLKNT